MNILYFDCFAGISGDMTLSALLDLGIDSERLASELGKLRLDGWKLNLSEVSKHGIGAKHVDVIVEEQMHGHTHRGLHLFHHHRHHEHPHVHRTMADIARLIDESGISAGAKDLAKRVFMRLAVAEAKVHGSTLEEVHFHEVGAVDSIIDIVGTAICIDMLAPDKICASILHDGHGFVTCQHGTIPVPVPAVTEVLAARGVGFKQLDIEGELMTPTGAAIIAELAESFGPMPEMRIIRMGYGAGTKDFPIPNLLRIVRGESVADESRKLSILPNETAASRDDEKSSGPQNEAIPDGNKEELFGWQAVRDRSTDGTGAERDTVIVIETNIDDTTPEILGYVMERLFEAGARDVFFSPVYMKKCRPATCVHVLCDEADIPAAERILFIETSTIGLRKYRAERMCLPRKAVTASTPYGDAEAKETTFGDTTRVSIEYEDARRLARENGVPLRDVYKS
ncbi:MAG: nickel pincer cofactor biosynthesis protein LarC [Prevotellaceae bacterium]|jgi:uncharacterized protein (TIGR00299 family) protein|nr:nickel pincer cofactor biosynthesis protein LarC [Prevotellaceae bacterium]